MRRSGMSLIELIIAMAIVAILMSLVLAGVQKIRSAAALVKSKNNLRQLILATQQLASTQPDRTINGLAQVRPVSFPYAGESIFSMLVPYTYGEQTIPGPNASPKEILAYYDIHVPIYYDAADFSVDASGLALTTDSRSMYTSYACNMLCFDKELRYPWRMTDGASNTLAYTQVYAMCGNLWRAQHDWREAGGPDPKTPSVGWDRRASVADAAYWQEVMPVRDAATGQTVASARGRTFQHRPTYREADYRVAQSPHFGGLPVALFDGSVRTISPGVAENVYWAIYTPDGGEVLSDF